MSAWTWMKRMQRRQWLQSASAMGVLSSWAWPAVAAPGPVVSADQALQFPRDFGAHEDHRAEWWYFTGQLQSGQGAQRRPWGFQITFFRSRVDTAQGNASRFAAHQLIMAHAALTDVQGGVLRHEQRLARTGFSLAEASTEDTHVILRSWTLDRTGPADRSRYEARVSAPDFSLHLSFMQTQPTILQGQAGYSRKGPLPEQASHYYSQPQLRVQGQLRHRQGPQSAWQELPVQGRAWMDHEWSESYLAPEAVGWDWVGMNLDDGSALTAFRIRRADGSTLWTGGSFRAPGQAARAFNADEVQFKPGRLWQSPATSARYPVEWLLITPAGRFTVQAVLDAQELSGAHSVGNIYWEGLSRLLGANGQLVGQGYLEMTGYAGKLRF